MAVYLLPRSRGSPLAPRTMEKMWHALLIARSCPSIQKQSIVCANTLFRFSDGCSVCLYLEHSRKMRAIWLVLAAAGFGLALSESGVREDQQHLSAASDSSEEKAAWSDKLCNICKTSIGVR